MVESSLRHDYNSKPSSSSSSSLSTNEDRQHQRQQPPPLPFTSSSNLVDTYQDSNPGNEADTEANSLPTHRKHRRSSTTVGRIPPLTLRPTTTSAKPTDTRRTLLRPGTSEGFTSSPSPSTPFDYSPSTFAFRSSDSNELRSPFIKRPPASRSSRGTGTSSGPPPAISTQRAFLLETQQNTNSGGFNESSKNTTESSNDLIAESRRDSNADQSATLARAQSIRGRSTEVKAIASSASNSTSHLTQIMTDSRVDRRKGNSVDGRRIAAHRLSTQLNDTNLALQDAVSNGSSHEDLFLNMAQAVIGDQRETVQESQGALPGRNTSSKVKSEERPGNTFERRPSVNPSGMTSDFRTPLSGRVSSREKTYASTAHPLDGRYTSRMTHASPITRRFEPFAESPSDRRFENPSAYHTRFRSTQLPTTTNAFQVSPSEPRYQSSDQEGPAGPSRNTDGTESSVSNTAPSTVWDELDDLKARIRKLEFTGKLPPSSSGSMERPRTAATSATTMSSSPKRNGLKSDSPTTSTFEDNVPHTLLTSALVKVKGLISSEAFSALEATATDAMNLARTSMTGQQPSTIERQLKRKADNMCRNLTELCIALAATNSVPQERPPARARSSSRDVATLRALPLPQQQPTPEAINDRRFERARSMDPEPSNGQRALSRLEARRTSMRIDALNATSAQASPQTESHTELKTPTQSTVTRTSTVLQRRRLAENLDSEDQENTLRPISRATTELARANTTSAIDRDRKRMSREYTSQYPLPSPFTRNFPGISNVPGSRRSWLANGISAVKETAGENNSNANSIVNGYSGKDKDLPFVPSTPDYAQKRYLNRNINPGDPLYGSSGRPVTEARQRILSSGQQASMRSYLSTRAGDRRSFVEATAQNNDQLPGGRF